MSELPDDARLQQRSDSHGAAVIRDARGPRLGLLLHPGAMLANLWRQRGLVWQIAQRDIAARYRSSWLGWLWTVLQPLALLAIYTFVFAVVFKARWGSEGQEETQGDFALALFSGMLAYGVFSEVVNRAPTLVTGNANYVKKVVFPLETLAVSTTLVALLNYAIGVGVWIFGWLLLRQTPPPLTLCWLPLILAPLALLSLALAWLLAAVTVFIRDVAPAVSLLTQVLFFATPVLYPLERVPADFRPWVALNPLARVVEDARGAMMFSESPDWEAWALSMAFSAALAWLCYAFFLKSRRAFGDVL